MYEAEYSASSSSICRHYTSPHRPILPDKLLPHHSSSLHQPTSPHPPPTQTSSQNSTTPTPPSSTIQNASRRVPSPHDRRHRRPRQHPRRPDLSRRHDLHLRRLRLQRFPGQRCAGRVSSLRGKSVVQGENEEVCWGFLRGLKWTLGKFWNADKCVEWSSLKLDRWMDMAN